MNITLEEYLMGREKIQPLTDQMREDAMTTITRVNLLLKAFGSYRKVTSGYRPDVINSKVPNAAKHSNHTICRACDLEDLDGKLDFYCITHQTKLSEIGLWLESPMGTPYWCHVQMVPPASGHRVFLP